MSKNYIDILKEAIENGILMDFCGRNDRDYYWGLYSDFCGFDFSSEPGPEPEPTGSTKTNVTISTSVSNKTISASATKEVESDVTVTVSYQYLDDNGVLKSATAKINMPKGSKTGNVTIMYDGVIKSVSVSPTSDDTCKYSATQPSANNKVYSFMYEVKNTPNYNELMGSATSFNLTKGDEKTITFNIPKERYDEDFDYDELMNYIEENKLYYSYCFAVDSSVSKSNLSILDDGVDKLADNSYKENTSKVYFNGNIYTIYEFADITHNNLCYGESENVVESKQTIRKN